VFSLNKTVRVLILEVWSKVAITIPLSVNYFFTN
jgi:hypothetical protein